MGEKTREKIQKTAEELGYVFDATAANLRTQPSDFVALPIPSLNNANFAETVVALTGKLSQSGYLVLLGHTNYNMIREEELIGQFLRRRPETIVVTGSRHTNKARKMLVGAGVPVIETWYLPADLIGHMVEFSSADPMRLLENHLADQGRKRIAFMGGDTESDTRGQDRRVRFQAAMMGQGLVADRLIGSAAPQKPMQKGAEAIGKLLAQYPNMDAVICVSDRVGFSALSECQRRGSKVPDQIAPEGFGAYDNSQDCVPTMTTIDPKPTEIGEYKAELVLEVLKDPFKTTAKMITPVLKPAQSTII